MRNWKSYQIDEICAIWKAYVYTDKLDVCDYCDIDRVPMRLTPIEITQLVDELLERINDQKEKDIENE